ncbi:35697_t:CDS:2, partial [Gigaspora margarita]
MLETSDIEELQYDVDPEFEQWYIKSKLLSGIRRELLVEGLIDDEEVLKTAYFTFRFHIKTIIHSDMPVEYPSTLPEVVATIFHIADWNNNKNDLLLDIELEGQKFALKECQIKMRKEAVEAEAIELQTRQFKASL